MKILTNLKTHSTHNPHKALATPFNPQKYTPLEERFHVYQISSSN